MLGLLLFLIDLLFGPLIWLAACFGKDVSIDELSPFTRYLCLALVVIALLCIVAWMIFAAIVGGP